MNNAMVDHDINPSFPPSEASIDIPEIIPPIICPKDSRSPNSFRPTLNQIVDDDESAAIAPLDIPLDNNTSLDTTSEQISLGVQQSTSNISPVPILNRQHMANNSINFVNPNSHSSPIQNVHNTHCLVIGGQRVPITTTPNQRNSSVINITKQNSNSSPGSSPMRPGSSPIQASPVYSSGSTDVSSTFENPVMMKAPISDQVISNNKTSMKGQVIKTPDQRLMFVTEVNGKRVGYLIQQPKQNERPAPPSHPPNPPNFNRVLASVQTGVNDEGGENKNIHDKSNAITNSRMIDSQLKSCSPINVTLDENKEIVIRHTHADGNNKPTEPLLKTDMKSLREKLLNLRNPMHMKNMVNSRSFPMNNKLVQNYNEDGVPTNEGVHSPNSLSSMDSQYLQSNDNPEKYETENDKDYDMLEEEEESQELEFSENELTAEIDESNHSSLVDGRGGDGAIAEGVSLNTSTDEEDSVPLSKLRGDTTDSNTSSKEYIDDNGGPIVIKQKKGKGNKKTKIEIKIGKPEKGKRKKNSKKQTRELEQTIKVENPDGLIGNVSELLSKKWQELEGIKKENDLAATPPSVNDEQTQKKGKKGGKKKSKDEAKDDVSDASGDEDDDAKTRGQKSREEGDVPSSPSLPSSSTSSSEDEEDSESAISRIREKAAELHKYLNQQRNMVTQKKKKARPKVEKKGLEEKPKPVIDKQVTKQEVSIEKAPDESKKETENNIMVVQEQVETIIQCKKEDSADVGNIEDNVENNNNNNSLTVTEEEKVKLPPPEAPLPLAEPGKTKDKKSKVDKGEDSDEEEVLSNRRKRSVRLKKIEETAIENENNIKRKRKNGRNEKTNKSEKSEKSESEDNSSDEEVKTSLKRKKSSRIKKLEEDELERKSELERKCKKESDVKTVAEENKTESDQENDKIKAKEIESLKRLMDLDENDENEQNKDSEQQKQDLDPKNIENDKKTNLSDIAKEPPPKTTDVTESKTEQLKPAESTVKKSFRIPKKSGSTQDGNSPALRGPRICIRQACEKPAISTRERGGNYCSNECLFLYCKEVFNAWVVERSLEEAKT